MIESLNKEHQLYNEIDTIIDNIINEILTTPQLNPYYNFLPFFHEELIFDSECETYQNRSEMLDIKNSPYFHDNHITIDGIEDNEDLRTIAHLSKFHKDRVAYDPKNLDRYLWSIGKLDYDKTSFDIVCYNVCDCNNVAKDIPYSLWRTLEDGTTPLNITLTDEACLEQDWYIESSDTPSEYNESETPMR